MAATRTPDSRAHFPHWSGLKVGKSGVPSLDSGHQFRAPSPSRQFQASGNPSPVGPSTPSSLPEVSVPLPGQAAPWANRRSVPWAGGGAGVLRTGPWGRCLGDANAAEGTGAAGRDGTAPHRGSGRFPPPARALPRIRPLLETQARGRGETPAGGKRRAGRAAHPAVLCVRSAWPGVPSAGGTAWSRRAGGRECAARLRLAELGSPPASRGPGHVAAVSREARDRPPPETWGGRWSGSWLGREVIVGAGELLSLLGTHVGQCGKTFS